MGNTNRREPDASDGSPLAVCINDCQLDYGQPNSELMPICFQVQCAFAEMRWGKSAAQSLTKSSSIADPTNSTASQIDF